MTRKTFFFEESSWFKVNYLEMAQGMALTSYATVAKELKLNVRKCWGFVPTFVDVTGEKIVGGFLAPHTPIQSRANLKR